MKGKAPCAATMCIFVFVFLIVIAFTASADRQETQEFLKVIGVKEQLAAYPQFLTLYIQYNPNLALPLNMGPRRDEIAGKINELIMNSDYFGGVTNRFESIFDENRTAFYSRWVQSDVGKRITQMEKLASAPDIAYTVLAYGSELAQNPPPEKRLELITRIVKRTGGDQEASELIHEIESGVAVGLGEELGDHIYIRPATELLNTALLDEAVLISALYVYQNATDDELSEYALVLEEKDTAWCLDQLGRVFKGLIFDISKKIGSMSAPYFEETSRRFVETFDNLDYRNSQIELNSFTVSFPKPPELQEESIPSQDGAVPMLIYYAAYEDLGTSFYASENTYPMSVVQGRSPYEVLSDVVTGMVGQDKVLLDQKTISMADTPGYEVQISVYNGMMLMRSMIFLRNNELTQISLFAPAYIHTHPKSDEFFSAFYLN